MSKQNGPSETLAAGRLVVTRDPPPDRRDAERKIRRHVAAGDVGAAITGVLRLYGPEVYGFIVALLDDPHSAREIYATVGTQMATVLPTFAYRCELRTWLYALARRELAAHRAKTGDPRSPLPSMPSMQAMRGTPTSAPFRQTSFHGVIPLLRQRLAPEEREILILRVDRRLSWRNLALTGLGEHAAEGEIARETQRLRDQFEAIRKKLTRIASGHGILVAR